MTEAEKNLHIKVQTIKIKLFATNSSTSFSIFKKRMIEFWMIRVWIDSAALPQQIYEHIANRGGLPWPGGSAWRSPRPHIIVNAVV